MTEKSEQEIIETILKRNKKHSKGSAIKCKNCDYLIGKNKTAIYHIKDSGTSMCSTPEIGEHNCMLCTKKYFAKGLCATHYHRYLIRGSIKRRKNNLKNQKIRRNKESYKQREDLKLKNRARRLAHKEPYTNICSDCGINTKTEKHHTNYEKNIYVELCTTCHFKKHGKLSDVIS